MGYSEKRFEGELALIAECSWSVEYSAETLTVHPDGSADLFVTGSAQVYVAGNAQSTRSLGPEFAGSLKGLRLKPCALPRIFGLSAHELTDRIVPVSDIPTGPAKRIASILRHADSADQAADLLLKGMHEHLANYDLAIPRMFDDVLSRLDSESVAQIATSMGVTERHLSRLFRDYVGISPTRMRRIRRFQCVLDAMRRWNSGSSLAGCALACGFADQAHFNRDIRDLAGTSPTRLLQELHNF